MCVCARVCRLAVLRTSHPHENTITVRTNGSWKLCSISRATAVVWQANKRAIAVIFNKQLAKVMPIHMLKEIYSTHTYTCISLKVSSKQATERKAVLLNLMIKTQDNSAACVKQKICDLCRKAERLIRSKSSSSYWRLFMAYFWHFGQLLQITDAF